jgi:hypothetical protein
MSATDGSRFEAMSAGGPSPFTKGRASGLLGVVPSRCPLRPAWRARRVDPAPSMLGRNAVRQLAPSRGIEIEPASATTRETHGR